MSGKIKSKDLSYDSSLPPFLQRLHDKNAGRGDVDRHERAIARPKRAKDPTEDDGPTVIDETGETVSKEEYEKLTKPETAAVDGADVGGAVIGEVNGDGKPEASGALPERKEKKVTDGLAASKKRKAAKVIGGEDATDDEKTEEPTMKAGETKNSRENKMMSHKPKKKAKPIKLAFDDGEEG